MRKFSEHSNLYLLDPIPVWKRKITADEVGCSLEEFNEKILKVARQYYDEWQLEVPDERHYKTKSLLPESEYDKMNDREFFTQANYPAVGKWHLVPTNNFFKVDEPIVKQLQEIILNDYKMALTEYFDFEYEGKQKDNANHTIDESWLQFYKNADYKVLHNHLRYDLDPTEHRNIWAGGYYISDGNPDKYQPYSGRFSFNTRNKSYLVKPETGMIMLWPGDILHEVHPFYGEKERICINFNLSTREEK
jgi:hypothetical protein